MTSGATGLKAAAGSRGFTLVEVLVASAILFAVFGGATLAVRTSMRALDRARAEVRLAEAVPEAMARVREALFSGRVEGEGGQGRRVSYRWKAMAAKSARNVVTEEDEFTGLPVHGEYLLTVYAVSVELAEVPGGAHKSLHYEELAWSRH
ncbi:MAG: type II secretion system protein [Deltaproteobacteria bacterium]|nr:type II secretion system protein [Deltaproteobacteria bacterium]